MVSLLGSITMVSIAAYFLMACLFLITEKWSKLKNKSVILSFVFWAVGGLSFIYAGSYAESQGLLGLTSIIETAFSISSLVLLGKVYFAKQEDTSSDHKTLNAY